MEFEIINEACPYSVEKHFWKQDQKSSLVAERFSLNWFSASGSSLPDSFIILSSPFHGSNLPYFVCKKHDHGSTFCTVKRKRNAMLSYSTMELITERLLSFNALIQSCIDNSKQYLLAKYGTCLHKQFSLMFMAYLF